MTEPPVYAGFWRRLAAHAIDSLLVTLILAIALVTWVLVASTLPAGWNGWLSQAVQLVLMGILTVWLWRRFAATPGKMALGMVIADADTLGPATTRQLSIRYLAYVVSLLPLGLGFFWVAFDARKQGWHDKLAGTVVLRQSTSPSSISAQANTRSSH